MGIRLHVAFGAALALAGSGCDLFGEPKADVANPKHYGAAGLAFDYPGNWTAKGSDETVEEITLHTAEVESKGTALVLVQQFMPGVDVDADELLVDFTQGMREGAKDEMGGIVSFADGSVSAIERTVLGEPRSGHAKTFVLSALGEKLPHTLHMFPIELPDRTVIVYTQIPDEDRGKGGPGFDLVLDTLKIE